MKDPHLLTGDYWRRLFLHGGDVLLPFTIGAWCSQSLVRSPPILTLPGCGARRGKKR